MAIKTLKRAKFRLGGKEKEINIEAWYEGKNAGIENEELEKELEEKPYRVLKLDNEIYFRIEEGLPEIISENGLPIFRNSPKFIEIRGMKYERIEDTTKLEKIIAQLEEENRRLKDEIELHKKNADDMLKQYEVLKKEMEEEMEKFDREREEILQKQKEEIERYLKMIKEYEQIPALEIESVEPENVEMIKKENEELKKRLKEYEILEKVAEEWRIQGMQLMEQNRTYESENAELKKKLKEAEEKLEKAEKIYLEKIKQMQTEIEKIKKEKENITLDYQEVLGVIAYTIDKHFYSKIINQIEKEKIPEIEKRAEDELIKEYKTKNPYKLSTSKKVNPYEDYEEYLKWLENWVKDKKPEKVKELKAKELSSEFYDKTIEGMINDGGIIKTLQRIKLEDYIDITGVDKQILSEVFDVLCSYVLSKSDPNISEYSAVTTSPIIKDFLKKIYDIMKVKDGSPTSYSTFAEEKYNAFISRKRNQKPIFGRNLTKNDIENIIELAKKSSSIIMLGDDYLT
ncbi:MAG: hypothetical protein QXP39_03000 [Candidatus Aenigmatarchaeota archaeon]